MIDLHMHLNGSLPAETVIQVAKECNIELPTYDSEELKRLISVPLDCQSLNDYLKCTKIPRLVTQTKEGLQRSLYLLLEDLKRQGLIYAEIRFAPQRHMDNGLSQEDVVVSLLEILEKSDFKAKLILCCMRGEGLREKNLETIRIAHKYINQGVGGVDLAGAEALFKTSDYKDIFTYAQELNLPITIHAGEADGAESVRQALDFGASRIGHGIRSIEDEDLLDRIRNQGVILELCPTSNLQTKAIEDLSKYPLRYFIDNGIKVTLNTDNKTISNTTLSDEYDFATKYLGLREEEKILLYRNAIEASFTNTQEKEILYKLLDEKISMNNHM